MVGRTGMWGDSKNTLKKLWTATIVTCSEGRQQTEKNIEAVLTWWDKHSGHQVIANPLCAGSINMSRKISTLDILSLFPSLTLSPLAPHLPLPASPPPPPPPLSHIKKRDMKQTMSPRWRQPEENFGIETIDATLLWTKKRALFRCWKVGCYNLHDCSSG